jgi:outer membrane protein assembly factor BamB
MIVRRIQRAIGVACCAVLFAAAPVVRAQPGVPGTLAGFGLQTAWELDLKLVGEVVTRIALIDDSLYIVTNANHVIAVHAPTGIIRWSADLADIDQALRGPTHSKDYVFFTTGGTVIVLNRRTGELALEPRSINGVVIEIQHDTTLISVGEVHGLRVGDTLRVYRPNEVGEIAGSALAEIRLESVTNRNSKGKLRRLEGGDKVQPGDRVVGDLELPLKEVKLPFAASCAAVADEKRIYVGAANQRFYSIDILRGIQYWQLGTPKTVVGTPVIAGGNLYFAGLDGRVVSCTKEDKVKNWTFDTEEPVFSDVVVAPDSVYVASSDRSLYCLDRVIGKRRWRVRFDTPLLKSPVVALDRVYQSIPEEGLYALDAKTGAQIWRREEGGQFLLQTGRYSYLLSEESGEVLLVSSDSGGVVQVLEAPMFAFGAASQPDESIYLVGDCGAMACLRSTDAPRLRPEQVVDVLRNDRRAKAAAEVEAARLAARAKVEPEAPKRSKLPEYLFEEDWLTSKSTARPVGGRGLAGVAEEPVKPKGKPAAKKAEESEEEGAAEESEAEEKPAEEGAADEATGEESEDEGEGAAEEESDEEESATTEPSDEDEDSATTKPADEEDEGDDEAEEGDEESPDEEGSEEGKEEGEAKEEESPGAR